MARNPRTCQHCGGTIPAYTTAFELKLQLYAEGVRRLWPERRIRSSILFTHCRVRIEM